MSFKIVTNTNNFADCRNTIIGIVGSAGEECGGTYSGGFARIGQQDIMAGIKKETEGVDIWDSSCEIVTVSPSAIFVDTVPITTPPTTAMPTTTISSSAGQTTTTMLPAGGNTTVTKMSTTTISKSTKSTKKSGSNKMSAGQSVILIAAAEVMALAVGLWFK